ncbi:hypothetical protein [Thermococcus sp.]|uniref:hypothetical protein n=1 Tax=Thermococcus sp. TaxID=35749 RepID=UPI002628BB48|nr:hypothetical protein [Thermococcus sp.]
MKKTLVVLLILVLAFSVITPPVSATSGPQKVFDIRIMLQVSQSQINGSLAWVGTFDIYVKLKDPNYRAYFEYLARKNETNATRQFANFVYNLVYNNLKKDLNDKLEGSNLSAVIYIPPEGPVHVTSNWSATVRFSIVPFLVPNGPYLKCPFYGPLDFVFQGQIYSFSWERLMMIFPEDYKIRELVPKPNDLSNNVAIWENGDYIPYIELYNPVYLFQTFINSTRKTIEISFDPNEGYLQFNATFTGMTAPKSVTDLLILTFRQSMKIMSISARNTKDGVEVIGVAKPEVAYRETRKAKIWLISIKLPGRFDRIIVRNGKYSLAPDGTLIITYTEEKMDYLPYVVLLAVVVGAGVVLWLWRRHKGEKAEIEDVLDRVDTIEIEGEENGGEE